MRDKSTKDLFDFLYEGIFWIIASFVWYGATIFRCVFDMTYMYSLLLVGVMLVISLLLGAVIFKYRRTGWTQVICMLIPLGLYTLVSYMKSIRKIVLIAMLIVGILTLLYTIHIMRLKIKCERKRGEIIKNRVYHCFCASQSLVAIAFLIIMGMIWYGKIVGLGLINPSIKATVGNVQIERLDDNIEKLIPLQEEWRKLTVKQKLNVLQTVANIEATYFELPHKLKVAVVELEESLLGYYSIRYNTIYINLSHIENAPAKEVVDTCLHEARHAFQHQIVERYPDTTDKIGLTYEEVVKFEAEFSSYARGVEDYDYYYNQSCEIDARDYAERTVDEYYQRINQYVEE